MSLKYLETEQLRDENDEPYSTKTEFKWHCKLIEFADDTIRVIHYVVNRDNPRNIG